MQRRQFMARSLGGTAALAAAWPNLVPSGVLGATAPSKKIQIGQIGCGRIARVHDLEETLKYDVARVVAVSDVDSRRMREGKELVEAYYAGKTGRGKAVEVKMYPDYRDMLADPGIDAVLISTPDHWHAQPAVEAARAGKHIYLQKPTSLTVREGRIVSDAVRKSGVVFQTGTQQRSSAQFRVAAELVRNGRIGKLHTVRFGLPGDPSGPAAPEMPVPPELNYDMWLGSTPEVFYTEMRVHPRVGYDRPGWLRCEQFGAGMITGWGQHHIDSAHWGMDTELTGPVEIEAVADFPREGLWDVHGDFMVKAQYANGVRMLISGGYPNGIRYEGSEGWIFVSRGNYAATASDPVSREASAKALDASNPALLNSVIGENEIHLYRSEEHHGNWLDCIQSGKDPISTVEVGHRACSACLISHIAMKVGRRLRWDPQAERFVGNDEANAMLSRPNRKPWGV